MSVQWINILNGTKSVSSLVGGFSPYDKYILLGCKEFNSTVDEIIKRDAPITLNDLPVENIDITEADIRAIDTTAYSKFLKEIEVKSENDNVEHKRNFLRKTKCYESKNFFRGFINWKSYNDGTPDIKMNSRTVSKLRGSKIIYFAYFSFNEPNATSIMDQMLFLNSLNHYGVSEINIVLPYFPVGTMERIVGEGEVPTGYALANMLNSIPSGASKNNIYIFDIHALCSRFFFHTNAIPVLITLMPDYLQHISSTYPESTNLNCIVFPDDGAKKRFEKLIPSNFNKIVCTKTRSGNDRIIKIESGMENLTEKLADNSLKLKTGKNINLFIVDDLVQSGGTLTETIKGIVKFLQEECSNDPNIQKIKFNTLVTHSVFPTDTNLINFFSEENKVNKLITSNSRPHRVQHIETSYPEKVSVIKIGAVLHQIFTKSGSFEDYIAPYSIN
jgi:phosphoribosylpyrophosphate synthetase